MGSIFAIFYFVLIMPMKNKQKKLEDLVKALKTGDKVIINPGIFGTILAVEDDAFHVRIDDKTNTRIKVLKSRLISCRYCVPARRPDADSIIPCTVPSASVQTFPAPEATVIRPARFGSAKRLRARLSLAHS